MKIANEIAMYYENDIKKSIDNIIHIKMNVLSKIWILLATLGGIVNIALIITCGEIFILKYLYKILDKSETFIVLLNIYLVIFMYICDSIYRHILTKEINSKGEHDNLFLAKYLNIWSEAIKDTKKDDVRHDDGIASAMNSVAARELLEHKFTPSDSNAIAPSLRDFGYIIPYQIKYNRDVKLITPLDNNGFLFERLPRAPFINKNEEIKEIDDIIVYMNSENDNIHDIELIAYVEIKEEFKIGFRINNDNAVFAENNNNHIVMQFVPGAIFKRNKIVIPIRVKKNGSFNVIYTGYENIEFTWRYVSKERLKQNNVVEGVGNWDRISDTPSKELLGE